ncbi:MAG: chemotaxis protein CheA [Pseudomonadota bacterium]
MAAGPDGSGAERGDGRAGTDAMADIRTGFFEECEELIETVADMLAALRSGEAAQADLDAAFRALHSIKGGAAAFGFADLAEFTHELENHFARHRDGGTLPDPEDIPPLQHALDRLSTLVAETAAGTPAKDAQPGEPGEPTRDGPAADLRSSRLRFSPAADCDTAACLRALQRDGELTVSPDLSTVPELDAWSAEACRLSWDITLSTPLWDAELDARLAEIDPSGALTLVKAGGTPEAGSRSERPSPRPAAAAPVQTVRVELDRVDRLMNLVGELVINQAMLSRSADDMGVQANSDHMLGLEELLRLTRDLQDSVMQIRAQPVKPLFQRMARICREAALNCGKDVELVTEGQETEIDKTVIERLVDPLTHMIRNAVDHALEAPEDRLEAGKPAHGTIRLRASHRSGQVILEVIDDGAGLDREKIRARALAQGLIAPDEDLSGAEIEQLLFMPGFTTASQLTSLSGRGVGLDVVRSAILGLGGRIAVESRPGQGTRFEVSLPLTLAVLDAMIVSVSDQTLVLPLSTIHETLTLRTSDILELTPSSRMLRHGGRPIALLDLGEELGYHGHRSDLDQKIALVIHGEGQAPTALAIDEIHEQRQVVIKGLQAGFSEASSVSGATILGDGRIALIIDPLDASLYRGAARGARRAAIPLDLSA